MKTFHKKINRKKVYKEYVNILNGNLQLSFREADVFSILLQLNDEWHNMIVATNNILSTDVRRELMRETRIKKTNLARYIKGLASKGILLPTEKGGYMLNEMFIPDIQADTCEIMFILEM
jgi:hypothetical protein